MRIARKDVEPRTGGLARFLFRGGMGIGIGIGIEILLEGST